MAKDSGYNAQLVRREDKDRFLTGLFAPPERRGDLWALFAFNCEIARTAETVSEEMLGLMRLQWWREALEAIYAGQGPRKGSEVLEGLAPAIENYALPMAAFERMLGAREFDLKRRPPETMADLETYARETSGPLLELAARIEGFQLTQDETARIGAGYALTGLARSVPYMAAQRRCYLPFAVLEAQGLGPGDVYEGKNLARLASAVQHVAGRAESLLAARPLGCSRVAKASRELPGLYLRQLRAAGYDLSRPRLKAPPFLREARLYGAVMFS